MKKTEIAHMIDKDTESGCWLWHGRMAIKEAASGPKQYPVAWFEGKQQQVARIVWERNNGPLMRGTTLHRLCNEERCVNPAHYSKQPVSSPIEPYKLSPGKDWRLRDTPAVYIVESIPSPV